MLADFLKNETAALHDAAEAKFASKRIFEKGYTPSDYQIFMAENYRMVAGLEPEIEKNLPEDFARAINYPMRRKLPVISRDAAFLGLDLLMKYAPEPATDAYEAIGMFYVLEGASLGGNVIKKQLQRTPGFENTEFHYLGAYGEELGRKWSSFIAELNAFVPEGCYARVLAGAQKAYRFLLEA